MRAFTPARRRVASCTVAFFVRSLLAFFGFSLQTAAVLLLAASGQALAAAGSPLVFLGDRDLPPYEFLENGKPRGANVDLALAVGAVLGRPVEIRLQDWAQAQSALLAGQADALTMLGRTGEREAQYEFSQATVPVSFALFVRADETPRFAAASYKGLRIGVTRAGLPRQYFESRHPEAELVPVESLSNGTRLLLRGQIDALAAQEWSQYYLLKELDIQGVAGLPAFSNRQGNIAVRRGDTILLQEIDRALSALKMSGEFDRIMGRWSHTRVQLISQSTITAAAVAGGIALAALLLVSGMLVTVRRQQKTLRIAQAQLKVADRHKDEFLATLAHELRNPLAPISNAARILQTLGDPAPQARQAQGIIVRQAGHLARLVDDLLDVSRINTGKLELRRAPVDFNAAVRDALEASQTVIDQAGHRLVLSLNAEPIWLNADRVRLAQIATNLLTNAAKYMASGGTIRLSTAREGELAVLRVGDEGVGIAAERLARVFDMFYQEDRSLGRAQGGLGIGLWLTRRLVLMHGGTIDAASAGEGRGSRFTVQLPVSQAPSPTAQPGKAPLATARRRILVVDDNRDGAETMAMLLSEMGHDVEIALSGEQALTLGDAVLPDLVLLDLGMPGMDGFEVCRRFRTTGWGRAATLVALTGWGSESDRLASRAAGFDAHITKPATAEALAALAAGDAV